MLDLADPGRRNALGVDMFAALAAAVREIAQAAAATVDAAGGEFSTRVLLVRGQGPAFCGGFDLAACVERPALLRELVHALSDLVQALRALPIPVVAQVQGAALAGGCAILAGCDFVVVAPDAQLGYPVHRIGVSPAVTLPALMANAGAGRAREVAMGGSIYNGAEAVRVGLASHLAPSAEQLAECAMELCERLATKGPVALRATKAWLNELDGTSVVAGAGAHALAGSRFSHTAAASAAAADGDEFATLLRAFWAKRSS